MSHRINNYFYPHITSTLSKIQLNLKQTKQLTSLQENSINNSKKSDPKKQPLNNK